MSRFGKGFRPSQPDHRDWPLHKLGGIHVAVPDIIDRDYLIEEVYDQGPYSSCCGWGTSRAWHLRARIQGDLAVPYPSALAIYSEARANEAGDPGVPLRDDGTYPRLALLSAASLGVLPLGAFKPTDVNARPDWETLRESSDRRGVQFARVYGVAEMRQALALGFPLVVGFDVDQSFEDYRGGVWNGMRGPALGGHCTCIFGSKVGALRGVNSWGSAGWGEQGLYWISDAAADPIEAWAVQLVSQ